MKPEEEVYDEEQELYKVIFGDPAIKESKGIIDLQREVLDEFLDRFPAGKSKPGVPRGKMKLSTFVHDSHVVPTSECLGHCWHCFGCVDAGIASSSID